MSQQRTSYGARVAAQIHAAFPLFPNVIMDLVLKLAVGKRNYDICASRTFQLAEFDFVYAERKSATKRLEIGLEWGPMIYKASDKVLGTFGGIEFSKSKGQEFFDSLARTKRGDETIGSPREILADQITLDPELNFSIAAQVQGLVQILGHANEVVVKVHKLLVYEEKAFSESYDSGPPTSKETAIFTTLIPFYGPGRMKVGEAWIVCAQDFPSPITVFDPREVQYRVLEFESRRLVLAFEVFDTGVPNPEARVISSAETFSKMIARGFNKVAIQSEDISLSGKRSLKAEQLRGVDEAFAEQARACGAKFIEVCEVFMDEDERIFRPQVLNISKFNHSFASCYRKMRVQEDDEEEEDEYRREDEEEDEDEEDEEDEDEEEYEDEFGDEYEDEFGDEGEEEEEEGDDEEDERLLQLLEQQNQERRAQAEATVVVAVQEEKEGENPAGKTSSHKEGGLLTLPPFLPRQRSDAIDDRIFEAFPRFDEHGKHEAVKDEYRLGDTLFLTTDVEERVAYTPRHNEEVGDILAAVVIIAHF